MILYICFCVYIYSGMTGSDKNTVIKNSLKENNITSGVYTGIYSKLRTLQTKFHMSFAITDDFLQDTFSLNYKGGTGDAGRYTTGTSNLQSGDRCHPGVDFRKHIRDGNNFRIHHTQTSRSSAPASHNGRTCSDLRDWGVHGYRG